MGGGFPTAAFGGRAELMALLAPTGPVYQAGTLSGNPVATAAGLATLRGCTDEAYGRLDVVSRTIADAASEALSAEGVPHVIQWAGSMFSVFFRDAPVTNYDQARDQSTKAFAAFFHAMLARGVHLPPSAFESWFDQRLARRRGRRDGARCPARRGHVPRLPHFATITS